MHSRRKRSDRMSVNAEINVVSLIDVMMLLMIVFMIAAPMMQGGVDVQLPSADTQPLQPKSALVVSIDQTGRIFIDRDEVTYEEFVGSIKAIADKKGQDGVYVRADGRAVVEQLVRVIGALRASGVTDIGLVAEPEEARRR